MIQTVRNNTVTLTQKGQKIIAAIFLVTAHLPQSDPMREKLRALAVGLVDCAQHELSGYCGTIIGLLESCQYAGLISEGNVRIIAAELNYFSNPLYRSDTLVSGLFPPAAAPAALDKGHITDKRTDTHTVSFIKKTPKNGADVSERKGMRQEKIVAYVTARKSASIKDVASLFPDVSEKTIQRELNTLVSAGKINRRGNKRWSLYLAA